MTVKTTLLLISASPGLAVPDSAYIGGTHQFIIGIPRSTRLHEASGQNCAPHYTTKEPPRVALKDKRSQSSGGHGGWGT